MNASPDRGRHKALADSAFAHDYPTKQTARQLQDQQYFQRAVQVYQWALPAVNMFAMKEGAEKYYGSGYNVLSIRKERLSALLTIDQ
jgi:hypothetical protein